MPKDTKTLGNSKARAFESLGFVHKKGCARVLTQPHTFLSCKSMIRHYFALLLHNFSSDNHLLNN